MLFAFSFVRWDGDEKGTTRGDASVVCCVYELFGIISRMMSDTSKFIYCNLFILKDFFILKDLFIVKHDAITHKSLPIFVMQVEEQRGIYISIRK
jgi:hypothetical protein